MIRAGIIGLGMMGRFHYAAWGNVEGAEVVAVADADAKRAAGDLSGGWSNLPGGQVALDMTRIRGTTDWQALVAMPEVDLVDICTPTPLHPEMAVAALEAGKHVVCEKPLALTSALGRHVAAAARKARRHGRFFLPAMCIRFWPEWAWLAEAVRDRRFGEVKDATFRRVGAIPAGWFRDGEASGGAILDLHVHDADFIQFAFGVPRAVSSAGYVGVTGCIDHIITRYIYTRGPAPASRVAPMVHAEGGWGMADGFGFQMGYTVNFERATAEYVMARPDPLVLYRDGRAEPVKCPGGDGYLGELAYMARCIASGTPPSVVTADDAVWSLAIIDAERRSVRTGRTVAVSR